MVRLQGTSMMRSVGLLGAAMSLLGSDCKAGIVCDGTYQHHLQGVASDGDDALFWSFTSVLVKTDMTGKILCQVPVKSHHGDLTYHAGKVTDASSRRDYSGNSPS